MQWDGQIATYTKFIANNVFYGIPDNDFGMEIEDETKYKLSQLLLAGLKNRGKSAQKYGVE
ncbi:MAG: hypothetical protein WC856_03095 [Methylococcaceae bacterium]